MLRFSAKLTCTLALVGLLCVGVVPQLRAQGRSALETARGAQPALRVHHSFPEAGQALRIVVDGFLPQDRVLVFLPMWDLAPPSVVKHLLNNEVFPSPYLPPPGGLLDVETLADDLGRLVMVIQLDDRLDAGRSFELIFQAGDRRSSGLQLSVQPPTLLVPSDGRLVRIDLRDGAILRPSLRGEGLLSAAFSADGQLGYVLRPQGLLEIWSAAPWNGRLASSMQLDLASDDLARSRDLGPAFVFVRPQGRPFTPPARLVFLDDRHADLHVEPMGQDVSGSRWAMSDDGTTAFVAEDDLLVREIDVLSGQALGVFTAGLPGDRSIADLRIHDGRLHVLTRRTGGQAGSLTVLDLTSGSLSLEPLTVDPLRLLPLDGGGPRGGSGLLVVPAAGGTLVSVEAGTTYATDELPVGRLLDVARIPGGALLLAVDEGVTSLWVWRPDSGIQAAPLAEDIPDAERLVSARGRVVLLLGAPDGRIHLTRPGRGGLIETIPGLSTDPAAPFAVLP